jgi:hypothetical protein
MVSVEGGNRSREGGGILEGFLVGRWQKNPPISYHGL